MTSQHVSGFHWLSYPLLAPFPLKQGTFLRHGGESTSHFFSLNVSMGVGDRPESVVGNREKVRALLRLPPLYFAHQVHGKQVHLLTSPSSLSSPPPPCDALVTSLPGVTLAIQHADCQAALFYDPKNQVIAAAHGGWRGQVLGIYEATLQTMKTHYGSRPEDLLVTISPSLGPHNSEFLHYQKELPKWMWNYQIRPHFFDLWAIAQAQLLQAGIQEKHLFLSRRCTFEEKEHFYSYRRDKTTGRHLSFIALDP